MPSTRTHAQIHQERLGLVLTFNLSALLLLGLNALSQRFEDSVSRVQASASFLLDPIWYLDDVVGPALFLCAGLGWLIYRLPGWQLSVLLRFWPLLLLAGVFVAFGLGDSLDAHWVIAEGLHTAQTTSTFTSFLAKFLFCILFCLGLLYGAPLLHPKALRALAFAFFLMVINQLFLSMGLDFVGPAFHLFEELLEVFTGLWLVLGVLPHPVQKSSPRCA